jgi:predicted TIM-barrel fold metal-dependent hydrolase
MHLNTDEHIRNVPPSRWLSDWALEAGHLLPAEDALECAGELYPAASYRIAGFPCPIREADLRSNNSYLAGKRQELGLSPFMCVRPEWDVAEIEETLLEGGFVGYKPYPDMVSGTKGADISIFDFFPHEQWRILDRYGKAVVLHLPRKERFASDENVKELLEARQSYPEVKIILAHLGRSYCPVYLEEGLAKLGDWKGFLFDTAAVINPATYTLAFEKISTKNILYGSDMPMLFWHGRRSWTERTYTNFTNEPFSWNRERQPPDVEARYTFFLYEQMKAILDTLDRNGLSQTRDDLFYNNAARILGEQGNPKGE